MKKCEKCGSQIDEADDYCPYCGAEAKKKDFFSSDTSTSYSKSTVEEKSGIAIAALIFGLLGGWLGLVFGIIGLTRYKETKNIALCIVGIVAFVIWMILNISGIIDITSYI